MKSSDNKTGDPEGNRTPVTAVKGRCLDRLTTGPRRRKLRYTPALAVHQSPSSASLLLLSTQNLFCVVLKPIYSQTTLYSGFGCSPKSFVRFVAPPLNTKLVLCCLKTYLLANYAILRLWLFTKVLRPLRCSSKNKSRGQELKLKKNETSRNP